MTPDIWGCSSVGRAPALHAGGQEFEPPHLHHQLYWKQDAVTQKAFSQQEYKPGGQTHDKLGQHGLIAQAVRACA
jgi:hypothetical protein